ncbi:MAG: DNA polymerase III subunit alpha [Dehalococcoidia bacterium]|nr:DNA polymerase III subunit alpha [Dehalococcoidia bacterium]
MFTHLHTHSEYSLLDGLSRIPDLVARAKEMGQEALAITDHGNLYGAIQFYEEARKHDLKPILGIEAYVAQGSRFDRGAADRSQFHLTLLAQNEAGYRNLLKLSTASHLEGFYYKPRMDHELLERHSEGLIALSACPSGEVMSALLEGREQDALNVAGWYRDVFKGRYYIELQEHGLTQFSALNRPLVDLARKLDLPLAVTNDSHYTWQHQHKHHDVLLCIGTNATVHDQNRMRMETDSLYLKSEAEMRALFPELPEAFDNTARIAEQVDIQIPFGRALLPDPGIPAGLAPIEHLRNLCEEGLRRRYVTPKPEQEERLRYELHVIEETGFVEYILIVRDIALFARGKGIPMGVRGSAAASIVLYCLGVTDIEPTQYRLVFERFLNLERREMPDVDFDFADDRREEVIRYASERYGRDRVAQIVTFGTLGAKAAIRDSGRALGMSYGDVDRVARLIPNALHVTLEDAINEVAELRELSASDAQVQELLDTARGLEGVARHASTHAAGIVISREPLTEVVPLQRATSNKDEEETLPTTQYSMNEVAKIGLVKMDFLGLANLTILGRAVQLIREQHGIDLDLNTLPDGDESAAAILAEAETFGIFQMESAGMRRYVAELQPRDIRELAAMVALYRPGPMEHIPRYIDVKHGRAKAVYPHADLASVLDETYGVITYQDQVLEIARTFAGYTLGQADIMRKAMGKKIAAVMLAERERFIAGAVGKGYEERLAEQVFDLIEPFAGYAFNKSHAFSYATIAYQTAYLKAHYPIEYMAAVLMAAGAHPTGALERVAAAVAECTRLGVEVLQPDVNRSHVNFTVERQPGGDRAIRFGLATIKHVGAGGVESLIAEREANGPFGSLEDFARRINARDLNRRVLESMAKAGALDSLGDRSAIVFGVDRILSLAQQEQRLRETGQTSMFDLFGTQVDTPLPALELEAVVTPQQEMLSWERELLGTYISEHPFRGAAERLGEFVTAQFAEIDVEAAGEELVVAGTVKGVRRLATKQGKPFGVATLEDLTGAGELTVWPEQFAQFRDLLVEGNVVLARVTVRERGDRLTIAAVHLAGYDIESGQLLTPDPSQFRVLGGRPARPRPVPPPPNGGPPRVDDEEFVSTQRPQLRAVEPFEASVPAIEDEPPPALVSRGNDIGDTSGPPRLRIHMEETTDEAADRRRLKRIVELLQAEPGDRPVELTITTRAGTTQLLRLPGVGDIESLVPRIQALLGVLGQARRLGDEAYERIYAAAAG